MEIIIWGTGVRGKKAKQVCDRMGRQVKAFVDNDALQWGKKVDEILVISPEQLAKEYLKGTQIWIATGAEEVYDQVKRLSDNFLDIQIVSCMLKEILPSYLDKKINLRNENVCNCKLLANRVDMLQRFSQQAREWKMAEIGVWRGDYSEQILKICMPQKLYLIDLWERAYKNDYEYVKERFEDNKKVEIRKGYSTDQLEQFEDGELDWVYIDTVHDYDTTKRELELSARKVSDKGYICGHDYAHYNVYGRSDYGVYTAVNEFVLEYNYEFVYLTLEWSGLQSFCLRKIPDYR